MIFLASFFRHSTTYYIFSVWRFFSVKLINFSTVSTVKCAPTNDFNSVVMKRTYSFGILTVITTKDGSYSITFEPALSSFNIDAFRAEHVLIYKRDRRIPKTLKNSLWLYRDVQRMFTVFLVSYRYALWPRTQRVIFCPFSFLGIDSFEALLLIFLNMPGPFKQEWFYYLTLPEQLHFCELFRSHFAAFINFSSNFQTYCRQFEKMFTLAAQDLFLRYTELCAHKIDPKTVLNYEDYANIAFMRNH